MLQPQSTSLHRPDYSEFVAGDSICPSSESGGLGFRVAPFYDAHLWELLVLFRVGGFWDSEVKGESRWRKSIFPKRLALDSRK